MPTSPKHPNRARPKPLGGFTVDKARLALTRAQNVEQGHPSKRHTAMRQAAEQRVLVAINASKGRKPGKL